MPLQATSGAASYDGFGGGVAVEPVYIEQIFSTWLYTGNGSTQTITNGIDLSTKGGLVWTKNRTSTTAGRNYHRWNDSARGVTFALESNLTDPQDNLGSGSISSFNTTGYTLGGTTYNNASDPWVSWTFRKQPKFFDVVTYTGDGTAGRTISHSLGSTPGCIIIKCTSNATAWAVYHRSLNVTGGHALMLNVTDASASLPTFFNSTLATDAAFTVGNAQATNQNTYTYVAYLFAHDAGGFGLTGTDNVISCGSYTGDDSDNGSKQVNLGFEPQWVLIKSRTDAQNWFLVDNMRGMTTNGSCNHLRPNLSGEEQELALIAPTATGFNLRNAAINTSGSTYIYIAIRRGPMKVPTSGTSVFSPNATTASINTKITTNFPVDLQMQGYRPGFSGNIQTIDRLRGTGTVASSTSSVPKISTSSTAAESSVSAANGWDNTGFQISTGWDSNNMVYWNFQRAPSFFDEVCYTGTGSATTFSHNLGVAPELMIVKDRSTTYPWDVYHKDVGASAILQLNTTGATINTGAVWSNTTPTASVFSIGTNIAVNTSGNSYVWYGFATCAGVSKVGSYTGNGSSQTINCGFTGGARFVMVKRTDSTGDWLVYDSARGIVSGNDPVLKLNNTDAESSFLDTVDTDSTGFIVNQNAFDANASGGTYIFLAIA